MKPLDNRAAQPLRLSCECGFDVASFDLDELAAVAQAHARTFHGMELSTDLITLLVSRGDGANDDPHSGRAS